MISDLRPELELALRTRPRVTEGNTHCWRRRHVRGASSFRHAVVTCRCRQQHRLHMVPHFPARETNPPAAGRCRASAPEYDCVHGRLLAANTRRWLFHSRTKVTGMAHEISRRLLQHAHGLGHVELVWLKSLWQFSAHSNGLQGTPVQQHPLRDFDALFSGAPFRPPLCHSAQRFYSFHPLGSL